MRRFYCENLKTEYAVLDPVEHEHLFRTLRARVGERVELIDGRGNAAEAEVEKGNALKLLSCREVPRLPYQLILCCAAPRKNKFELLLKPAAELGVSEIRLMECTRSVALPEKVERAGAMLKEGCKQSGNPYIPVISPVRKFDEVLGALREEKWTCFYGAILPESSGKMPEFASGSRVAWIVGPEGGFTPEEESRMRECGVLPLNLGPYVMRLETAAAAGLAVLTYLLHGKNAGGSR